jgi:3-dehydroquinate synthetase
MKTKMNNIIFLYGAPASGKTTLGKQLAERIKADFFDLDKVITDKTGKTIPRIFLEDGEAVFRDIESEALAETISEAKSAIQTSIISLGGGTLLRDENRKLAESSGVVICLDTPSDAELERRIGSAAGSRPLGNKAKERAPHYASFKSRISFSKTAGSSLVIGGSSIARIFLSDTPYVSDATVNRLYSNHFKKPIHIIPSGEEHKTPKTVSEIWNSFGAAGLGRKDIVASLGGGVTSDLTGFAAATWMRGIRWMNFPTTLLSMVDASTGGKTGCDLPIGKNLAGAFHQPEIVVIDTDFLETLPENILSQGKAEMIKHEIIGNLPLSSNISHIPTAKEIGDNLSVKIEIVERDPLETKGERMLLNCGHTIAHAVEMLSNFSISHGDAVAIGCVAEAEIAEKFNLAQKGWAEELAARFTEANLPVSIPENMTWEKLIPVMRGDKKRQSDKVDFALPCGWGDVRIVRFDLSKGLEICS